MKKYLVDVRDSYDLKDLKSYLYNPFKYWRHRNKYVIAYKFVDKSYSSPIYCRNQIVYHLGQTYQEIANTSRNLECSKGLHVATKDWCFYEGWINCHLLEVEFQLKDIASIPYFTDGKFRVKKLTVTKILNTPYRWKALLL